MDQQPDPEMLESLELLVNWDLIEHEADWDVIAALDNTPVRHQETGSKKAGG